jgi:hypothetical protein
MLPPLVYGFMTFIFEWYTWPSALLYVLVGWALVLRYGQMLLPRRRALAARAAAAAVALAAAQWVLFAQNGLETRYMREIGQWLGNNTPACASALLEPIGCFGFHFGKYVHDWTSLVSPEAVDYRRAYGRQWMGAYLRDEKPTYVIITAPALREWSEASSPTLQCDYVLVKTFQYESMVQPDSPVLKRIARLGSAVDFLLYERRGDSCAGTAQQLNQ